MWKKISTTLDNPFVLLFLIIIFFLLGNCIMLGIYDRYAYYKASLVCRNMPEECHCKVVGGWSYYHCEYQWKYQHTTTEEF